MHVTLFLYKPKTKKMKSKTINFDFYDNPSQAVANKGAKFHVRILNNRVVDLKELGERIAQYTTGSEADVMLVMTGLRQVIVEELAGGNAVSIDGICRIEPTLGVVSGSCEGNEKGNSIQLKTLRSHAVKSLIEDVREKLHPCSRKQASHSHGISEIETYGWLTEFFQTHAEVSRHDVEEGLGLTRYMTTKYLNRFMSEGKLRCPFKGSKSIYVPVPGFFGKSKA